MIYILHGPDDYSISRELDDIKHSCGDPSVMATNTVSLDADVSPSELRVACETVPFLADKRLVLISGLLDKFTSRPSKNGAAKNDSSKAEQFANLLLSVPPFTVVVLIEDDLKETNALFKLIANKTVVKAFPFLKAELLRKWIENKINVEKGSISPSATALLVRLIGGNLWVMSSEITKLLTYTEGKQIEERDVKAIVSYAQEFTVFNMIDAIIDNNLAKAENILQQLLVAGESPIGLLAMFARQMRLIVRFKDLKNQKLPDSEIRSRLGINQEFILRKTAEQAGKYTIARLKYIYQQLLDTDIAVKTGSYEPELALNLLVAELCRTAE